MPLCGSSPLTATARRSQFFCSPPTVCCSRSTSISDMDPRPASTVTLIRDTERGPEVLMLKRNLSSAFVPGVHVFPGGTLDDADHAAELQALCDGPEDAVASRILSIEHGGLAYWIAAIRELFEEAGVLLARSSDGALLTLTEPEAGERFHAHRKRMESGEKPFNAVVADERLRLATDRLRYFGHWITPEGAVRRYDTRFFVAVAPEHQVVAHDNREAIAHEWVRPARPDRAPSARRMQAAHADAAFPPALCRFRYDCGIDCSGGRRTRRTRHHATRHARRAARDTGRTGLRRGREPGRTRRMDSPRSVKVEQKRS